MNPFECECEQRVSKNVCIAIAIEDCKEWTNSININAVTDVNFIIIVISKTM